ncbi:MAG: hypothetical protein AB8E15_08335 [Bdellovibrionales bacterium]
MRNLLLICGLMLLASSVFAQDVYNFYFQKGQGAAQQNRQFAPQYPNQVPPSVQPMLPPTPAVPQAPIAGDYSGAAPVQNSAASRIETEDGVWYKKHTTWELGIITPSSDSFDIENDSPNHALSLGLNYQLSEHLSFDMQVATNGDYSLGFLVHPMKINFFSHDLIEYALGGGFGTTTLETYNSDEFRYVEDSQASGYAQAQIKVNMTKNLGLVFDAKAFDGGYYRSGVGIAYQL